MDKEEVIDCIKNTLIPFFNERLERSHRECIIVQPYPYNSFFPEPFLWYISSGEALGLSDSFTLREVKKWN